MQNKNVHPLVDCTCTVNFCEGENLKSGQIKVNEIKQTSVTPCIASDILKMTG